MKEILPVPTGLTILADTYLAYLIIFVGPVLAIGDRLARVRIHDRNRFNFACTDAERSASRLACAKLAVVEVKNWLTRHRYDVTERRVSILLQRADLWTELLEFSLKQPSRWQFFLHLRRWQKLNRGSWRPRYRFYRGCVNLTGFLLGYHLFLAVHNLYRRARRTPLLLPRVLRQLAGQDGRT